jgi:hypothetical protein
LSVKGVSGALNREALTGKQISDAPTILRGNSRDLNVSEKVLDIEAFRELGLLNDVGKPRLNRAIGYFCNSDMEFDLLEDLFCFWRDFAEYIVLRKGSWDPRTYAHVFKYVAVKCSKRGNDVYNSRMKKRFRWLDPAVEDVKFFKPSDFKCGSQVKTQALWLTLTYNSKRSSRREAWEHIGIEWNRFISAMRRRYGQISVLRSWEAFKNGYPHIHAVLWFHDANFSVFPHFNVKQGKMTYRINEKRKFEDLWHSFVDVEAFSSLKKIARYAMKYQLKVNQGMETDSSKGAKTLSFMWLFRKRSYSVSGSWRALLADLISRLRNSNMERQVDLEGIPLEEGIWEFVGVFSGKQLGINRFLWSCPLNKDQIDVVLSSDVFGEKGVGEGGKTAPGETDKEVCPLVNEVEYYD